MPQTFQVTNCYMCKTFQVQQKKKSLKWQCKMCGEKQSLKKVYGEGSGSDCRHVVQKLNLMRGSETSREQEGNIIYSPEENNCNSPSEGLASAQQSKWEVYVDSQLTSDNEEPDEPTNFCSKRKVQSELTKSPNESCIRKKVMKTSLQDDITNEQSCFTRKPCARKGETSRKTGLLNKHTDGKSTPGTVSKWDEYM